ncbi:MAG: VanZ family protein [Verrucomicrobia bacterium]|nr:VanZ family protein [Verrucomicrobiota bacterium]
MRIKRPVFKFWLPPLIWMLVIFSASGDAASARHSSRVFVPLMHWLFPQMTPARIEEFHYLFRKGAHLTEFAVLALLLWHAIRHSKTSAGHQWLWQQAGLALVLVLLYAAGDEIHQAFVPGRTGQLSDVMVDTAGGIIGLSLLWLAGRIFKRW